MERRKLDYLLILFIFIIFIVIIGPFSVQVRTRSKNSIDDTKRRKRIQDASLYLIKGMEKYVSESIWPDNEFPVRIYIAKKGTNLVGSYELKEVTYINPEKEKVSSKEY